MPTLAQRAPRGPLGLAAVVIGGALILVGLLGIVLGWGSTSTAPPASTTAQGSTPPAKAAESPQVFFSTFLTALANRNQMFLFDRLDPAVVARFGTAECRAAVAHLHPLNGDHILAVGPTGTYRFATTSGPSILVPHVTTFTVQDPSAGVVHVHFALIDGRYRYFADCAALGG